MTKCGEVRIPKQKRSLNTKNQIVEAAMKLFSEKGYHGTNTKEIAKEAGVATGCFYSYFTDKKSVFKEALLIYCNQFNTILREHSELLSQHCIAKKDFFVGLIKSMMDAHNIFTEFHNELIVMCYSDKEIHDFVEK
ncbi:MAG: TetR/AcrR family transcriptional regulator, partial [Bacillota bacterium]|nr:TetR/AcrR family transcriptional regulator [Bacillota bacterium]